MAYEISAFRVGMKVGRYDRETGQHLQGVVTRIDEINYYVSVRSQLPNNRWTDPEEYDPLDLHVANAYS